MSVRCVPVPFGVDQNQKGTYRTDIAFAGFVTCLIALRRFATGVMRFRPVPHGCWRRGRGISIYLLSPLRFH
jgi:hypothetical protein